MKKLSLLGLLTVFLTNYDSLKASSSNCPVVNTPLGVVFKKLKEPTSCIHSSFCCQCAYHQDLKAAIERCDERTRRDNMERRDARNRKR